MSDRGEEESWWERIFRPGRYRNCVECGTPTKNFPTAGVVTCDDCQKVMPDDETPYDAAMDDVPEPAIRRVNAGDGDDAYGFDGSGEERSRANRRWVLGALVAAGGFVVLGACTGDQSDGTGTTEDEREILYDTTVEGRLREEHEFVAGDVLYIEASVNHEGKGSVTLNVGPGDEYGKVEGDPSTLIKGSKSFSREVEHDGVYIFNAIAGGGRDGRMELLVEVERSGG